LQHGQDANLLRDVGFDDFTAQVSGSFSDLLFFRIASRFRSGSSVFEPTFGWLFFTTFKTD